MAERARSYLLVEPWGGASPADAMTGQLTRVHLLLPDHVRRVVDADTNEALPRVGDLTDERRFEWRCFELPAAQEHDSSSFIELVMLDDEGSHKRLRLERPLDDEGTHETITGDGDSTSIVAQARRMVESYVSAMALLGSDRPGASGGDVRREESCDGAAAWRLADAIRSISSTKAIKSIKAIKATKGRSAVDGGKDKDDIVMGDMSRGGVIEEIARSLTPKLRGYAVGTGKHRQRLRRQWVDESVGIAWAWQRSALTRHAAHTATRSTRGLSNALAAAGHGQGHGQGKDAPGDVDEGNITVLERSLALIRHEAIRYASEAEGSWETESLVSAVDDLRSRGAERAGLETATLGARTQRLIERSARRLLAERAQRASGWRWRQRVWAEACQWAVWSGLEALGPGSVAGQSRVFIRAQPESGRWLSAKSGVGCWRWRATDPASGAGRDMNVLAIEGRQVATYAAAAPFTLELIALRPDVVLVCRDPAKPDASPLRIVCVWGVMDLEDSPHRLVARCEQVDNRLKMIRSSSELVGVIVQPGLSEQSEQKVDSRWQAIRTRRCWGVRAPLEAWRETAGVADWLVEVLTGAAL